MPNSISPKQLPSPAAVIFAPACSNSKETAIGHSTSSPPTDCSLFAISAWQDDQISFSKAALNHRLLNHRSATQTVKLQGKIFGGNFTGDAEVNQWLAPAAAPFASGQKNTETATISPPHLLNKSRQKIAQTSSPKPPAIQSALNLAASARSLRRRSCRCPQCSRSPASRISIPPDWLPALLKLVEGNSPRCRSPVRPRCSLLPRILPPAELPLTAHASGVYYAATETLDLPQFNLTTPTSHVQASGTLSPAPPSASRFPLPVSLTGFLSSPSCAAPRCFPSC